jgi:hypothetical protein
MLVTDNPAVEQIVRMDFYELELRVLQSVRNLDREQFELWVTDPANAHKTFEVSDASFCPLACYLNSAGKLRGVEVCTDFYQCGLGLRTKKSLPVWASIFVRRWDNKGRDLGQGIPGVRTVLASID